jgi:uroporphyrinogen decarboxylase
MKLIESLQGKVQSIPPLWMMRQAGRYLPEYKEVRAQAGSFFALCDNPELATEVTLQPIDRFGFDAAIIFSDILVTLRALGLAVDIVEKEGPKVKQVEEASQVEGLDLDENIWLERLKPTLDALTQTRAQLESEKALIGFAGAPLTLALYATCHRPGENAHKALKFAEENLQAWQDLIDKIVDITVLYLNEQVKAGANALQVFDSWAGAAPEDKIEDWVITPLLKICARMKALQPNIPIILFPRQLSLSWLEKLANQAEGKFDALGLGQDVDLKAARPLFEGKVALQGNLDPEILLQTPEKVLEAVTEIKSAMVGYPGFVFNLGHGITPPTPLENVQALVDSVRN